MYYVRNILLNDEDEDEYVDFNNKMYHQKLIIGALMVRAARESGMIDKKVLMTKVLTNLPNRYKNVNTLDVLLRLSNGHTLEAPITIDTNYETGQRKFTCNAEAIKYSGDRSDDKHRAELRRWLNTQRTPV